MRRFDYLYNFKNPIRHFFNLRNVRFDAVDNLPFGSLTWTTPVKFKVFKTEESQRTISFPNILNFYHAIKHFESETNFYAIDRMSSKKRIAPDLDIGEFSAFSYYDSIKRDVFNLTKYDKLLVLDIKSFYGRIYTHDLGYASSDPRKLEQRVGSLNNGRTNGLLLGSYLSLYLGELILSKLEAHLDSELHALGIDCHYEYFSDDFYFFCNNSDVEKITKVFAKILDEYGLEVNYEKTQIFDFEEYTQNNNLEKLWKAIINQAVDAATKQGHQISEGKKLHSPIFTQLVYRLSQIHELKYKRIFLANFFKTYYFHEMNTQIYVLSESDFNHICYIYKLMPEAILYSLHKIRTIDGFDNAKFKDFIKTRFKSSLFTEKQEEQLYFYYAMKICGFDSEFVYYKELVLKSKNQILISYYLIDNVISKEEYQACFDEPKESEWLQNYHFLLTYDKSGTDCLIPLEAKKVAQKDSYRAFYQLNLDSNIPFLKPISSIARDIDVFISTKIDSYNEEKEKRGL